ncbi:MAG: hypothetical protein KGL39_09945 [Patescibacteria group bacterium]|nr:hypothetical protein [Patescibacteria group bacterium]
METKRKSNSVVTVSPFDSTSREITFNVMGAGEVVLHIDSVHAENLAYAALHGFKQRISDAAALSRNPTNGQPASPENKRAAMQALVDHYESGSADWSVKRASGAGRSMPNAGLILQAIAEVYGMGMDWAKTQVEKLAAKRGVEYRAALKLFAQTEKVGAKMAELRAKAGGVDADELLGELDEASKE